MTSIIYYWRHHRIESGFRNKSQQKHYGLYFSRKKLQRNEILWLKESGHNQQPHIVYLLFFVLWLNTDPNYLSYWMEYPQWTHNFIFHSDFFTLLYLNFWRKMWGDQLHHIFTFVFFTIYFLVYYLWPQYQDRFRIYGLPEFFGSKSIFHLIDLFILSLVLYI